MVKKRSRGFTLIELLVAVSVASVVLAYLFYVLSAGLRTYDKLSVRVKDIEKIAFTVDKITNDVMMSKKISPASDGNELTLSYDDEEIIYSFKNSKVRRQKGGSASYLTVPGDISQLKFVYPDEGVIVILRTSTDEYIFLVYPRNS
jgi:prepilin-type N-terminal cleavage/methylation domain-containing protein